MSTNTLHTNVSPDMFHGLVAKVPQVYHERLYTLFEYFSGLPKGDGLAVNFVTVINRAQQCDRLGEVVQALEIARLDFEEISGSQDVQAIESGRVLQRFAAVLQSAQPTHSDLVKGVQDLTEIVGGA